MALEPPLDETSMDCQIAGSVSRRFGSKERNDAQQSIQARICCNPFIGGKARNMHLSKRRRRITGTGGKDKTTVLGILERGGKVKTTVVRNRRKKTLQPEVKKHVEAGSALYTDALLSYDGLESDYAHQVIDHAVAYVDGKVHTNGLENFWSLLKRGLNGTYVSVEPFHLFRYLDEQAYRFNHRKLTDSERFEIAVFGIVGKRLTWDQVTGKELDSSIAN